MFACGKKKIDNGDKILDQIRSLNGMNLGIKLNEFKLEFNEQTGDWKNNLNDRPIFDENVEKKKEELDKLKEESKMLDSEIHALEKEYLAKVAKLLLMTQVHCEIKADINNIFDEMGFDADEEEEGKEKDKESSIRRDADVESV